MNYALIENGIVTNIIWLYDGNAGEFPTAVKLEDRRVEIGDTYEDGRFYRDGVEILTAAETAAAYQAALAVLGIETEEQNAE